MALTKINTDALSDNAVTLAKMASGTDGEILTYDASGNPVAVSVGTDGQVLTSTGVGSPPAFETAAGGGKVVQSVYATASTETTISSTTFTSSGLEVTITPTSGSNKIIIWSWCPMKTAGDGSSSYGRYCETALYKDSTNIAHSVHGIQMVSASTAVSDNIFMPGQIVTYESATNTTARTYKYMVKKSSTGIVTVHDSGLSSYMIVQEVEV
jgi:hypothetical protein